MPTPLDALNYAKRLTGNLPIDDANLKPRILNDAHEKLWTAAPWRWSVGYLDIVTLQNDTQDYAITPVADFLGIAHSYMIAGQEKRDLSPIATLPQTTIIKGVPTEVAYIAGGTLRVLPVPTGYATAALPRIVTLYKKTATAIGAANEGLDYTTTFGMPADWFWVFQEIVLLKAYQFGYSPRAGAVTMQSNGVIQYSGQYGVVEDAIQAMRRGEMKYLTSIGTEVANG